MTVKTYNGKKYRKVFLYVREVEEHERMDYKILEKQDVYLPDHHLIRKEDYIVLAHNNLLYLLPGEEIEFEEEKKQ